MKEISAEILTPAQIAGAEKSWSAVFADLVKARLTTLVLLTTLVGFYAGWSGPMNFVLMFNTLAATALVAAGAAALNQLLEREYDAKMRRTQNRPLPSGRLQPATVAIFGGVSSVAGLVYLALAVNLLTSVLGAVTLISYLFIYTPLKRVTWLNTAIGAIPGAFPPLMGWTAARGELSGEGWALFAILAFWQIPHFFAIAWMYRDEYAKAGFVMLPNVDPSGRRTAQQTVSHALALLIASLAPFALKMAGPVYLAAALIFGAAFLWLRDSILAAAHAGARATIVSGFNHLSAAAAGGDGLGQGEVTWNQPLANFRRIANPKRTTRMRSTGTTRASRSGLPAQLRFFDRPQNHRHPIRPHGAVLFAVRIFPDAADALADCASGPAGSVHRPVAGKNSRARRWRATARFRRNFTIPSARCTGRSWCFSASCRWRSPRSAITSCR